MLENAYKYEKFYGVWAYLIKYFFKKRLIFDRIQHILNILSFHFLRKCFIYFSIFIFKKQKLFFNYIYFFLKNVKIFIFCFIGKDKLIRLYRNNCLCLVWARWTILCDLDKSFKKTGWKSILIKYINFFLCVFENVIFYRATNKYSNICQ